MKKLFTKIVGGMSAVVLVTAIAVQTATGVASPARAKITFSFDDGRVSTYTKAAPTLAKYGMSGTAFITTGCVGMTKVPNTCHAANDVSYVTWDQIAVLKNTYNWEIGSHSKSHPYMASTNASDGQPTMLSEQQVINELVESKAELAAHGFDATAFASPYGDYSTGTLQQIAKNYTSHRGFADQNNNVWPYDDLLLQNMQVQTPVSVADVQAKIDYAVAHKTWLVLTFHDIVDKQSSNPNKYQWATQKLDTIARYVKAKQTAGQIEVVNVSGGLVKGANIVANGNFASGLSGWTTDNSTVFSPDNSYHGSAPEAQNSVRVRPAATAGHLLSSPVAVNSNTMYVVKSYLNVTNITGGEIGYYIDEYDANGKWISGQYKGRETSVWVETMNFSYVPSSIAVKTARLQLYTSQAPTLTGYFDNVEWFAVASDSTVAQQNLMPNGTFDAGISSGWHTDDTAAVRWDTASHGAPSNPVNSVALTKTGGTAHLFAPSIAVDATKTYYLENYLMIAANNGGEIGYYIDEYDTNGAWVSGQYKSAQTALGGRGVVFSYTPTTAQVKTASLQIIVNGGNGISAYVDDSRWRVM